MTEIHVSDLDKRLDELWDAGILGQKKLDEINEIDLHQLMDK